MNNALSNTHTIAIKNIIKCITEKVSTQLQIDTSHGLLSGLAGHLLFLYNAYKLDSRSIDEALFANYLDVLQEQLGTQSFELSNGLAGQAWLLEYLNQGDMDDYDPEFMSEVDTLFIHALSHEGTWQGEVEMVLGLGGYTPYAAKRAKYSDQTQLFNQIVSGFASTATRLDNGQITWSQPAESVYRFYKDDKSAPEHNLGLAHGVPGIIAALLPALTIPSLKEQVRDLLLGSCDWLLAQQATEHTSHACFASHAGGKHNSRLGWCYGDLTIALTLARAGNALDKPSYVEKALEIALHASKRDAKSAFINDAGLCHGYFGLMTIYQLLHKAMPNSDLKQAMFIWLEYGLKEFADKGMQSLYTFNGIEKAHKEDFSFLMGYSGIGMMLISVLTDDIDWADCLLMA
ncbi:lanthionine synthetase C family protein [Pseudoalteromonas sp. SG45-5]|uniref:lanthionine synthetase C family protein n=1 Tax=unclassified Pseudoalteromonas TaxID=194690 RepID=UPI0015FDF840|nr:MULTISPECIES: lanthionine synthetase C family protein [unclassified Pseudoalteromonas]MBB1385588.1 lanthionine synthetase C family protein [Pseudoalteromonas sp. SG45-5]MBB1393514.1 lanthionine synthetase C family protein [Pseudoalteromonas sp. SG44-4]MBB1445938.1 lanthionine synthetase C family protein [Pseudoalteromonas sp. SG41-6]